MKMRKLFAALTGAVTALTVCASLSAQATDVKYVFQRTKQGTDMRYRTAPCKAFSHTARTGSRLRKSAGCRSLRKRPMTAASAVSP